MGKTQRQAADLLGVSLRAVHSFEQGCLVLGNDCPNNGWDAGIGAGVYAFGKGNRIEGNNVFGNDYGIRVVADEGNLIIRNSARGNTTANYNIDAGNTTGPFVGSVSIGASSNPHANYDY